MPCPSCQPPPQGHKPPDEPRRSLTTHRNCIGLRDRGPAALRTTPEHGHSAVRPFTRKTGAVLRSVSRPWCPQWYGGPVSSPRPLPPSAPTLYSSPRSGRFRPCSLNHVPTAAGGEAGVDVQEGKAGESE